MGETKTQKHTFSLPVALLVMFVLMATHANAGTFGVTTGLYTETENLTAAVQSIFGGNWIIADWTNIKQLHISDSSGFSALLQNIGIQHVAWVTNEGARYWGGTGRHYFVQQFSDGRIPGYFLAHDRLTYAGKVLALGSWYGLRGRIVAYCPEVVPEPSSMIVFAGAIGSFLALRRRTS